MATDKTEKRLNDIGQEVMRIAQDATGRVLAHVSADEGVISSAVYFVHKNTVIFKFPSDELVDLLFDYWESTRADDPKQAWREMALVIDDGRFRAEFSYEGDLFDEPPDKQQRRFIHKYFGVDEWDDSDPEPTPRDD